MLIGVRAHLNGIAWSSEFRTVVQRLVPHINVNIQAPRETTLDCLQNALNRLGILRKYSRLQAEFTWEYESKFTWESGILRNALWNHCYLIQPHQAVPNANAPFVGFKDSTKWLLIFCSGSMQLAFFRFGVHNNWLCLAETFLVPQWVPSSGVESVFLIPK